MLNGNFDAGDLVNVKLGEAVIPSVVTGSQFYMGAVSHYDVTATKGGPIVRVKAEQVSAQCS